LLARVIAVADSFDAMTTDRPYRNALPIDEARRRLSDGSGSQWDERCIAAILELIDSGSLKPPSEHTRQFGSRLSAKYGYQA